MTESDKFDKDAIKEAAESKCCPRCGMDLKELIAKRDEHWNKELNKEFDNHGECNCAFCKRAWNKAIDAVLEKERTEEPLWVVMVSDIEKLKKRIDG